MSWKCKTNMQIYNQSACKKATFFVSIDFFQMVASFKTNVLRHIESVDFIFHKTSPIMIGGL